MEFSEYIKTPKIEDVLLEGSDVPPVTGTACLTGHHLILYCNKTDHKEHWLLHKNVDAIEKRFTIDRNIIVLKCKDFKLYQLTIPKQDEAVNIASSVEALSNLNNPAAQYPYFYRPTFKFLEDGYDIFSTEKEFSSLSKQSDQWRVSNANIQFKICQSYPSQVIVPKFIEDSEIMKSAQFRQGGRFPVLSYYHTNGRVLMRCGQPLMGPSNKRCKEDERLVNAVLGSSHRGYILDTRTSQSAQQARSKGGGFETEFHYPQWRKIHNGLLKYSVQQESLIRIVDACQDQQASSEKWQSKLESSSWMSIVKDVLSAACLVAQCIDREGASVLVHGSEGIDCTLQITSLSQVILDPYCRTIRGFLCLVDKEWIQAGHPFRDRCFHSAFNNQKIRSEGPSFTVFLECVYQLQKQFPLSFEFTDALLCQLHKHAYASEFGSFLCNNEMERRQFKVRTKTVSLWSYFLSDEKLLQFLNSIYQQRDGVIWPSVAPQSMHFWDGLFLPDIDSSPIAEKVARETLSEMERLQNELSALTAEVDSLKQLAANADVLSQ